MSVAVEEMLHMSLSANIYFALFGESPKLYGKAPQSYPTALPNHKYTGPLGPDGKGDVSIPLGKLSYDQLWHFLQIETPGKGPLLPKDSDWESIGQFYSYIRCMLRSPKLTDSDFRVGSVNYQIQSYNYSANNIDTASPRSRFNEWKNPGQAHSAAQVARFANDNIYVSESEPGSANPQGCPHHNDAEPQLMTIGCRDDALQAIDTICEQGEGLGHSRWDVSSHYEISHYYKFLKLQAQFEEYQSHHHDEELPVKPIPPLPVKPTINKKVLEQIVFNFPDNPKTEDYPEELQPISQFCNGLFQYMLIMTETIFQVYADPNLDDELQEQKHYFNISLHRSMIWVLDKYIQTMRKIDLPETAGQKMAPTFEFVCLGDAKEAFKKLTGLGQAAINAGKNTGVSSDIEYYVGIAVGGDNNPLHLPDVADYLK